MLILKTILSVFVVHLLTITHINAASTLSRLSGEALELAQASKRLFTVASASGSIRNFSSKENPNHYDALALISGGPDSSTLAYHLAKKEKMKVLGMHFYTGLRANEQEIKAAKAVLKPLGVPLQVIDISHFVSAVGNQTIMIHSEAHAMKFGTAVLLSMASGFSITHKIPRIALALHSADAKESVEYSPPFIDYINQGLKLIGESKHHLVAPFHDWEKQRIISYGHELGLPLHETWSCVSPIKDAHCGTCGACRARKSAFENAGVKDNTKYHLG